MSLIQRLEQLTGPDREIDKMVARLCGWTLSRIRPHDKKEYWRGPWRKLPEEYYYRDVVPSYTASINVALTLVPDGMEFEISNMYGIVRCTMGLNCEEQFHSERKDCNWAIALTIAALKARGVK